MGVNFYPHGHDLHSSYGCSHPDCIERQTRVQNQIDEFFSDTTIFEGDHSTIVTNMEPGGWVETKTGALVSVEYAQSINRAERRKQGIKL